MLQAKPFLSRGTLMSIYINGVYIQYIDEYYIRRTRLEGVAKPRPKGGVGLH